MNEAGGKAAEILGMAAATAESIEKIGAAVIEEDSAQAIRLDLAGNCATNWGHLARPETDGVLPAALTHFEKLFSVLDLSVRESARKSTIRFTTLLPPYL